MRLRAIASTLVCQLCLAIVCQAGSALADKVEKAQKDYDTAKESAAIAYRKAFSEALDGAKKVEIYLLTSAGEPQATISDEDPFSEHLPNDLFPILPYKSAAKIIQRKLLSPKEIALLLPSLKTTITAEKDGVMAACHEPIHGLRIWDGKDLIFQTSICYHCENFYMTYPDGEARWIGLTDPNFQKVMEQLMPIPAKKESTK